MFNSNLNKINNLTFKLEQPKIVTIKRWVNKGVGCWVGWGFVDLIILTLNLIYLEIIMLDINCSYFNNIILLFLVELCLIWVYYHFG